MEQQQTLVKQPGAEEELTRTRMALAAAVNAHNLDAIKQFVHPSYKAKSSLGITWKFEDMMSAIQMTFKAARDFQETVEIESIQPEGDAMLLTTRRRDNYTLFWFLNKREDTRQVETWKQFDGRWMIVEEKLLGQHAHLSIRRPQA